jgi:dTDP-glucose 4,6-dehydratase
VRVVLAGGAGFIGSHLTRALLERGDEVMVADNLITGDAANLASLEGTPGLSITTHDVSTPLIVDGRVDAVLHLASPASPPDYHAHPVETLNAGTFATYHLLELAVAQQARFLLASTSEVYGDPLEHPQRESYWGHVNPIGPRSVYDEAKRCAEAYTMAYHRAGLSTRIARIFNTYGPQMRLNDGRAVPNFIAQALAGTPLTVYGDGSQTRSLCYVDDLVRGLLLLLDSDEPMPVNLGNPAELTILELAHAIADLTGTSRDAIVYQALPEDDPKQRRPDITRAQELLGWQPEIPLQDGLKRTLAWARDATPSP